MSSIKLGPYGTLQTYLSTELNSLADGANKLGGEIDNASDLDLFMDVEIALAAFTPGTSGFIQIFSSRRWTEQASATGPIVSIRRPERRSTPTRLSLEPVPSVV